MRPDLVLLVLPIAGVVFGWRLRHGWVLSSKPALARLWEESDEQALTEGEGAEVYAEGPGRRELLPLVPASPSVSARVYDLAEYRQ